ncbi:hypothetical protein [Chitinophaga sp. CF418]|uniref:hypothetical protein n=1 Tax=Chitinophaga sp. CF418 TaxID=1855287 RepID=UPI0009195F7F|nr:hypothetical protein [Chitinophaga sp. CF418]SHN42022.1 hypothetical protein SAMN05216311_11461 [Chitinophaga sp. CF418]
MISRDNDIANELREIIPDAQWTTLKPSHGGVPAGYFEQLPGLILQKVRTAEVQEELEMLSPLLAGVPKSVPLSVPPGYFEHLSQQIIQNITTEQQTLPDAEEVSSILAGMPKAFPMSAPAGYFDQLDAVIMARIAETEGAAAAASTTAIQEELAAISPLLAGIPKTMPLSVPTGYFDQLSTSVMAGIADVSAPVHNPVVRRMNVRKYMGWAVAACLVALVSVSTLFFIRGNRHNTNAIESTLANVSDQEIMEYLQSHSDAFDKEELTNYTPLIEEGNAISEVEELPAEAIQHYLDNTGLLNESLTDN